MKTVPGGLSSPLLGFAHRHPYWGVVAVCMASLLVSVTLYIRASESEESRLREQFLAQAEDRTALLQKIIDRDIGIVEGLGSLYDASNLVEEHEFRRFVSKQIELHKDIQALEWAPRVAHEERAAFEAEQQRLRPDFQIREIDARGEAVPAAERPEYFPITLFEPVAGNEIVLGLDTAYLDKTRNALVQARDTGELSAVGGIRLAQERGTQKGMLIYRPVYRQGAPMETVAQRRKALSGLAIGVFHIGTIVADTLNGQARIGIDFALIDAGAPGDQRLLHVQPSRMRAQAIHITDEAQLTRGLHAWKPLRLPGQQWWLLHAPAPAFYELHGHGQAWIVLAAGLIISSLLTFYLAGSVRKMRRAEALANRLAASNLDLAASKQQLDEAQHIALIGSWEYDVGHGLITCSAETYRIFDRPLSEGPTPYETWLDRIHPDDRARVRQSHIEFLQKGQPYDMDFRLLLEGGRIKYLHVRGEPRLDKTDKTLHALGTVQDVTQHKLIEGKLRLAASVFENSRDGIFITDRKSTILDANQALSEIVGYERAEIVGKTPKLWRSARHDETFYRAMWQSLEESGYWRGEILNRRKNGQLFPAGLTISTVPDETGQDGHYVAVISDISELKHYQSRLEHLAQHDPLTNLPNRLLFSDRLSHAITRAQREEQTLAVLFLDLDRFKHINDSLGHPLGDRMLQEVAQRLLHTVREEDTVARMGGDEFTILMEGMEHTYSAGALADRLIQQVSEPYAIDGLELSLSASIGISLFPRDAITCEMLIRNADAAMYLAKETGRSSYQFYTPELTEAAYERITLESELREALRRGQLELHYQPQLDIESGTLVGAEALLRWRHPQFEQVSPARFIPVAEDSGLILSIGAWVLAQACAQAKAWIDQGLPLQRIAVNVAGPQLERKGLLNVVGRILAETGLEPDKLELEVTETFVMSRPEHALDTLAALRKLGVGIAIDDFGTGYSSLSHLKRLPIDKLKIDRSFITDLPDDTDAAAITRAVIAMGQSLGLKVLAEGVETEAQRDFVLREGCMVAQGYLFGRPVPADEFIRNITALGAEPGPRR